jgi:D-2-hydroxyacid dehydrogenase (NADP+)
MKVSIFCQFWNPFWSVPETNVEELRSSFPDIDFINIRNTAELLSELPGVEVHFGYRLDGDQIRKAESLRWIHVPAANVFGFDTELLMQRKILLTNAKGEHVGPISEHVIGTMIVFSRRFMECWDFQKARHYAQKEILHTNPPLSELRGKTVFILGYGNIGKEVARLCKAFGMRVLASKRKPVEHPENVDRLYLAENFREGLSEADYIVITMARTKETEGLLGEAELSMLKPDCVIINVARANIIRQKALFRVLKEEKIRGAALDVYEQEPLPETSELYDLPNVFLTPHLAGVNSAEHWNRMFGLFSENLNRYLRGEMLINLVDLNSGY